MEWQDVIQDPSLKDLPYKIELNERGQIVMSPASNRQNALQFEIASILRLQQREGGVFTEASIRTGKGVKVPDVIWGDAAFFSAHRLETPYRKAPDICIEVLSPSNTDEEIEEKRDIYFECGAKEVWLCDKGGNLSFFASSSGVIENSELFPEFPKTIDIPWAL